MARQNHALAWRTLNKLIADTWAALAVKPCELVHENVEATTPPSGANWARVNIRPAGTTNRAIGRDELRGNGVVMIQIFIRKGVGALEAQEIADALSSLTNTEKAAPVSASSSLVVTIRATGPASYVGTDPAGGWEIYMCEIPYHFDSSDDDS